MAARNRRELICRSHELKEGRRGIRFQVRRGQGSFPAFIVRYEGKAHAYLNRCAHRSLELDWNEGDFFDVSGRYLVCATHGAFYGPASGICLGGPCNGAALEKLPISEENGDIVLESINDDVHLTTT